MMNSLDSLLPKLTDDEEFDDTYLRKEFVKNSYFKGCYSVWKSALVTW